MPFQHYVIDLTLGSYFYAILYKTQENIVCLARQTQENIVCGKQALKR